MNRKIEPGLFASLWPHAIRLLLGGIFLYSGYIKIIDPASFAKNVYQYLLLPDHLVNIVAMLLPWLEVVCGGALIFIPRLRRGAAAWITTMLVIFTSAILISIFRGLDISCGCFSSDPGAAKIGWMKVAENSGLLVASLIIFRHAAKHPSNIRDSGA